MVPKDATLLSKGKPVTSSDKEEPFEGELGYVTDGSKGWQRRLFRHHRRRPAVGADRS